MSEHSTEELKRQVDAAYSRLCEAEKNHILAKRRLHERMCRDSGFLGKIVEDSRKKFNILVTDVEFMNFKPWALRGFQVNSDGKVGYRDRRVWVDDAVITAKEPNR